MQTFAMGPFRFDVLSRDHQVADSVVRDRFIVEAFYHGEPLDWHPNQEGAEDFPGFPHRQIFDFIGKPEKHPKDKLPAAFERTLLLKARKAVVAAREGKQLRHVSGAELRAG